MSIAYSNSELVNQNLNKLIRTYANDAYTDAKALAQRILAPVKTEFDSAINQFSTELFITVVLHVVYSDEEPTLQKVIELIDDSDWVDEKAMFYAITIKTRNNAGHDFNQSWRDEFAITVSGLSEGEAFRMVRRCHVQWSLALGLPIPRIGINLINAKKLTALPANLEGFKLECIRISSRYELSDAIALAKLFLGRVKNQAGEEIYQFAYELFVAVTLYTAHSERCPELNDVVSCLTDSGWDSTRQIYTFMRTYDPLVKSKHVKTKTWVKEWADRMVALPIGKTNLLTEKSHELWKMAFTYKEQEVGAADIKKESSTPPNSVKVFDMEAICDAFMLISGAREDRRNGGDLLLKKAQENKGYRTLPDAKQAGQYLEKSKTQFENLVEPISRLQMDLTLCANMEPSKFRVTPILLLGDPGIGKTHLAMELAKGLGGSMDKLSAGGAQGAFQLTGSHSSWTGAKFGSIVKVLAEGTTTSPVIVIDEVDKIGSDDRYPILPVLLDLFEADTARCFKDEFFDMEFDASRIIFILTANSLDNIPEALLSRVEIFDIPRPDSTQRLRIIQNQAKELRELTGKSIKLNMESMQKLADMTDIDLRKTIRIVKESFTKAIIEEAPVATLKVSDEHGRANRGAKTAYQHTEIGFSME